MKRYITLNYFKTEFGWQNLGTKEQAVADTKVQFFIDRASSFVDNAITGGAVEKAIREGKYTNDDTGALTLVDDTDKLEVDKLNAFKECVAMLTKFGIDTGYDFLTGSFSNGMGAENYSESLQFKQSFDDLVQVIRAQLGVYDWTVLNKSGSIKLAMQPASPTTPTGSIDGSERTITGKQLYTYHEGAHIAGHGITITPLQNGEVRIALSNEITVGGTEVDDTSITETENIIAEVEVLYDDDLNTGGN